MNDFWEDLVGLISNEMPGAMRRDALTLLVTIADDLTNLADRASPADALAAGEAAGTTLRGIMAAAVTWGIRLGCSMGSDEQKLYRLLADSTYGSCSHCEELATSIGELARSAQLAKA